MKTAFLALLIALFTLPLSAQLWQPDFETAQKVAAEKGQNIVLVFSGSDWCAPCIKLERDVWEQEEFATAAGENFVFYKADFPRRKANKLSKETSERNASLAELYNTRGSFPLVVVLSPEGDLLGQTGYKKISPVEYADMLKNFTE
ncbi:thioredoxin family protein [Neolewinella persica]|uniref:thioredoxin family protein n=1 Tax=Neolewinella persica TaxID=70998 RepID=UPI00035C4881|nr:thioredoxin family protein [Neolewinella persica]